LPLATQMLSEKAPQATFSYLLGQTGPMYNVAGYDFRHCY
jgi:hypothetical protein